VRAERTTLRLRVSPGAARPGIVGRFGEGWKVRVTAPPEAGKANDAVLTLLADALDVSRHDVELTSGRSTRDKVVVVRGMTSEAADARLSATARGGR
jgi:uncharacterized protein